MRVFFKEYIHLEASISGLPFPRFTNKYVSSIFVFFSFFFQEEREKLQILKQNVYLEKFVKQD